MTCNCISFSLIISFMICFNLSFILLTKYKCLGRNCVNDADCLTKEELSIYYHDTEDILHKQCEQRFNSTVFSYDCYCTDTETCGRSLYSNNIYVCLAISGFNSLFTALGVVMGCAIYVGFYKFVRR